MSKKQDNDLNGCLIAAIRESNLVAKQSDKVNARKAGVYVTFTKLASEHGQETFEKGVSTVFEAIKANTDDVAVETGCKPGKKEGTFVVPSAAMSAKSTLLAAFEFGVPMLDDETEAPRAFSAIRTDVTEARAAEAAGNRSDEEEVRDALCAQLEALVETLREQDVDASMADSMASLSTHLDTWQDDHAALSGDVAEAA